MPNITMGAPVLTCVKKNVPDIFMDCHMMVADPAKVGKPTLPVADVAVGTRGCQSRGQALHLPLRGYRSVDPGSQA